MSDNQNESDLNFQNTFQIQNGEKLETYEHLQIQVKQTGENDPDNEQKKVYVEFSRTIGDKVRWLRNHRRFLQARMEPLQKPAPMDINDVKKYKPHVSKIKDSIKDGKKKQANVEDIDLNFKGGLW